MEVRLTSKREVDMHALTPPRLGSAAVLLLVPVLLCCAPSGRRQRSSRGNPLRESFVITRPQIDSLAGRYPDAYDLIRAVRPNMLIARDVRLPGPVREGTQSDPSGVKVFLDDAYVGGVDVLRRIPSRSIIFVQHLSPLDATTRYGSGMVAGVIVVTMSPARWQ